MVKGAILGLILCLALFLVKGFGAPDMQAHRPDSAPELYSPTPERQSSAAETQLLKSKNLPMVYDYLAPDGAEVRLLVEGEQASMAQFRQPPGHTSRAVAHKSVEELWYIVSGRGRLWRKLGTQEEDIVELAPGVSVSLPPGTHFQFKSSDSEALEIIGVTVPAWPGADEAFTVEGKWPVSSPEDRKP